MPSTRLVTRETPERQAAIAASLEMFYPIHYQICVKLEDELRGDALTRHQLAILWLIRCEGGAERELKRARIERALKSWYGIGASAVSKALRALAEPPHELLALREDPDSGREKRVSLTERGVARIEALEAVGNAFITRFVASIPDAEFSAGVKYLMSLAEIMKSLDARGE